MGRFIFVSLGLLVVAFSLRGSGSGCPSDWSSYDKHCYKVFDEGRSWDDAERFCMEQQAGSHLASILSSEEEAYVAKLAFKSLKHPMMWIGLGNIWNECSREWSDGSSFSYEAWREGPKCTLMKVKSGYINWYSVDCKSRSAFTCKFPSEPGDPAPE